VNFQTSMIEFEFKMHCACVFFPMLFFICYVNEFPLLFCVQ